MKAKIALFLLKAMIACAAVSYLAVCVYVYAAQDSMVFKPSKDFAALPDKARLPYEDIRIHGKDGVSLSAWHFPLEGSKATVLFLHGNSWNMGRFVTTAELYRKLGLACLMIDYRGYGSSSGKPSEEGLYADAESAYRWLTEERKTPSGRIVIAGRSLGGALAARLAAKLPCAGLSLESAFTSLDDEGSYFHPFLPIRLLSKYRFDTAADLAKASCPLLVVHSRDDKTVPFAFGKRLFELAPAKPKSFVELRGSHNDCYFESGDAYPEAFKDFAGSCVSGN